MQISLKYKQSRTEGALHSVLLQVVAKFSYGVEGVGGLDSVGVVSDDDSLGGLEGDNTLFALGCISICIPRVDAQFRVRYLLRFERVVACFDGHVLYAVDLDTFRDDLLGI
jgi:hypothetical protein